MSSSVVTVGVIAGVVSLTMSTATAGTALVQRQALHGAADMAALAAADTLYGFVDGDACVRAGELAQHHGTEIVSCEIEGLSVIVRLQRRVMGFGVQAVARAGLPEVDE